MTRPAQAEAPLLTVTDMLVSQQHEGVYFLALVVALITVGILFWLFGSRCHRLVLTVLGAAIGMVVGWYVDFAYGINVFLGMVAGVALGAAAGYWLFRLWLGVLSGAILSVILFIAYAQVFVTPSLRTAARERKAVMESEGLTLQPGVSTRPGTRTTGPVRVGRIARGSGTPGEAYERLRQHLGKFARGYYSSWEQWRENLWPNINTLIEILTDLVPSFTIALIVLIAAAMIAGIILTIVAPRLLNVTYTAATGSVMVLWGVALLLTWHGTAQARWVWYTPWVPWSGFILMTLVGAVLQHYLYRPEEAEEDEEDEDEEQDPPKKGRKKARK